MNLIYMTYYKICTPPITKEINAETITNIDRNLL